MGRVLEAVTQEKNPGDITTTEDEGSVEEAGYSWHQMRAQLDAQPSSPANAEIKRNSRGSRIPGPQ